MEYEIESEEGLFDASTNPSLRHGRRVHKRPPIARQGDPKYSYMRQRAEQIPEEEDQLT
ncbi:hypothetical protein [Altererythrobacter sp. Root672]|uniref:hypothetical protein n=1 Tax=Altererythrobacter sp. Root672 TaxID=1736584 RepID=UPI000AA3EE5A|nr:hypothetical protein [Altererythrobacter sp. Root672]